uniref:Uncharacterized protein n=1 Tax=Arundo donax TaxID=35708 RepID=A0A0A9FXB5_ARUDO
MFPRPTAKTTWTTTSATSTPKTRTASARTTTSTTSRTTTSITTASSPPSSSHLLRFPRKGTSPWSPPKALSPRRTPPPTPSSTMPWTRTSSTR